MPTLIERAKKIGFANAAIIPVCDLKIVPEYRSYCEENKCGCYDRLPVCPPKCGTVTALTEAMSVYDRALILQTVVQPGNAKELKHDHNVLTEQLLPCVPGETLVMSAGPWKTWSCMSAYCVDAQAMADRAGMCCWANDGLWRFFSLILYHSAEASV